MPRSSITFVCRECGGESLRWAGQCPHCRAWNTLEEFAVKASTRAERAQADRRPGAANLPQPISEVDLSSTPRLALEWDELNRVLGGGVVPGSLILLGGEPGVGKSTLLMHLALQLASGGGTVLYTSGEESVQQIRIRAGRLGALSPTLLLLAENDLDSVIDAIRSTGPRLAVVDSIQTVYDPAVDSAPGSVTQVREATGRLMRMAKETGIPLVLVGHVTKEGAIAGPRVLEHMVDTVLYLEGERQQELRILRATKNRFGSTDEIGIFSMGEEGLAEVADAGAALLSGASLAVPGTAVLPALEGTRPLLVEIQSLIRDFDTEGVPPRRSANGFDLNRLHIILAVVEKRVKLDRSFGRTDVFVNVAGGIRVTEPAADLALALSVISNRVSRPLADGMVVIGELGLTGEVRRVSQVERRLLEAQRRGFTRAIVPAGSITPGRVAGIRVTEAATLSEAVAAAFPIRIESGGGEAAASTG